MSQEAHIFVSYAHEDSEFALRLARDLRSEGVNIWRDEPDIPLGVPWDRAVEQAIRTCDRLLVILSPASAASENVLNEVAFALDREKQIVPVLYRSCEIPLRLLRLKRVDFTSNYNQGLTTLVKKLRKPVVPLPASLSKLFSWLTALLVLLIVIVLNHYMPAPSPPARMNFVFAGEFTMGSPEGEGSDDEHPPHTVYLDAFHIDPYEVTNEQFVEFVAATDYRTAAEETGWGWVWRDEGLKEVKGADWRHPHGPDSSIEDKMDYPVVQLSWNDAVAYCQWVGKRLPTEAEWEKAARGIDGRKYPWGNEAPDKTKLNYDWNVGDMTEVGSYANGAIFYSAYDMAGNVWEWVADWYDADYYSKAPEQNPQGPDSGEERVQRGGGWGDDAYYVRTTARGRRPPDFACNVVGVRCAASPGYLLMVTQIPALPTRTPPPPP